LQDHLLRMEEQQAKQQAKAKDVWRLERDLQQNDQDRL
jgi:hypothetical protein